MQEEISPNGTCLGCGNISLPRVSVSSDSHSDIMWLMRSSGLRILYLAEDRTMETATTPDDTTLVGGRESG